jgi:hypothetical protein
MDPLGRARFATVEMSSHADFDPRIKRAGLRTLYQRPNETSFAVGRNQIVDAFQIRIKLQMVRRPRTGSWCSHFRGCIMRFHVQSPKFDVKEASFNENTSVCSIWENSDNTTSPPRSEKIHSPPFDCMNSQLQDASEHLWTPVVTPEKIPALREHGPSRDLGGCGPSLNH